ncbi:hypothetical protein RM531_08030 [Salinisphaera sp. P385]|uniref:Uncharacterized protein n=1 Tax=Spectribacter acetivorans TaxID=3075603 RepID=A0ABU3B9D4_9GAMM|nr:hypothetical protein [Salinisphaera sp. P385]MDT0618422.1 hypothetical protein [Salinisphaera sp. P385]
MTDASSTPRRVSPKTAAGPRAAKSTKSDALLVRFGQPEARHTVSRDTVRRMSQELGLRSETQVVQYALAQLRDSLLPRYEPDDGPLSAQQLEELRASVDQEIVGGRSLV